MASQRLSTRIKAVNLPANYQQEYLDKEEIKISMDGKGRAIDNIFIERFWRTVKRGYVYLHPVDNGTDLFLGLKRFMDHYNNKKPHQGIGRIVQCNCIKSLPEKLRTKEKRSKKEKLLISRITLRVISRI